jgi:hypothetical protein
MQVEYTKPLLKALSTVFLVLGFCVTAESGSHMLAKDQTPKHKQCFPECKIKKTKPISRKRKILDRGRDSMCINLYDYLRDVGRSFPHSHYMK